MASDDSASVCSVTITPTENETKCFSKESIADQQNVNINQNAGKMLPPNALLGVKQGAPSLLTPNTPKMASLAAPVPMQSSVYTANQPKNSLTAASASLSVASATGNPRNKVALRKGRGLMDWVRLGHTTPDLAGTGGRLLRVTPKQLAKHNTKTDAWMALRGKVYNVTPYMEYHPGGEDELSRGIGRDATELFNEVHKWVNFESMLCKCLVGHLVEQSPISCSHVLRKPQKAFLPLLNSFAKLLKSEGGSNKSKKDGITKLPPIPSPSAAACTPEVQLPSYDWYQSSTAVTLTVYSRWPRLTHRHCTVHLHHNLLSVDVVVRQYCYRLRLELSKPVTQHKFQVKVGGSGCGKVSIEVQKAEANVRWTNIGRTLPGNQELISIDTRQRLYHSCRLYRKQQLTHDIVLLSVQCPPGLYLPVPSGYHTFLRTPGAPALSKPYTPVPENLDPAVWAAEVAAPGNCLHYLVKVYPDGDMSQALDSVTVSPDPIWNSDPSSDSSVVEITLAEGEHVERLSRGEDEEEMTQKNEEEPPVTDVALLAAGTGITPMLSTLLDCIILKRRVRLLFFNKTEDDVPWRDELDVLAAENSDIIKVHHVLSSGGSAWSGLKGRVSLDLLERMLPVADGTRSVMLAVCGPTGFTDLTLKLLDGLGYLKEEYHAFVG